MYRYIFVDMKWSPWYYDKLESLNEKTESINDLLKINNELLRITGENQTKYNNAFLYIMAINNMQFKEEIKNIAVLLSELNILINNGGNEILRSLNNLSSSRVEEIKEPLESISEKIRRIISDIEKLSQKTNISQTEISNLKSQIEKLSNEISGVNNSFSNTSDFTPVIQLEQIDTDSIEFPIKN
jgi:chromosome segregation ATPase